MTKVELYNSALMTLGAEPLSKETDQSRNGKYCRSFYPIAAKAVLESFHWNCARKRVKLAAIGEEDVNYKADLTELTYQYELPEDYLRIESINDQPGARRLVEGGYLFCDEDEITLIYTSDISEPDVAGDELLFSGGLANSIAMYMAYRLASAIIKDKQPNLLYQEYQRTLIDAQGTDAMERFEDEEGGWIE